MTRFALIIVGAFGLLAQTHSAHAQFSSGAACTPAQGEPQTAIGTPPWGVGNSSTTSGLHVHCALDASGISAPRNFTLFAYDRNSSGDVTCKLSGFDGLGNLVSVLTLSTSGGGIGSNIQRWALTVPSGATGRIWTADCTLPPATFDSTGFKWQSHLVGFRIDN